MKKPVALLALALLSLTPLNCLAIPVWVFTDPDEATTDLNVSLTPDGHDTDRLTYSGDMKLELTLNAAGDRVESFTIEDGRTSFSDYAIDVNSDIIIDRTPKIASERSLRAIGC